MNDNKKSLITHDAVAIFGSEALSWEHERKVQRLTAFWNEFWSRLGGDGEHPIVSVYADDCSESIMVSAPSHDPIPSSPGNRQTGGSPGS